MFDGVNDRKQKIGSYLQVSSEFEITFDPTAAVGSRLISLALSGTPVVPFRTYRVTRMLLDLLRSTHPSRR